MIDVSSTRARVPRPVRTRVRTSDDPGAIAACRSTMGVVKSAPQAPERAVRMTTHTPLCELLGIEYPIVSAPMAADVQLPVAVSNAGGLGTMGLWWVRRPRRRWSAQPRR